MDLNHFWKFLHFSEDFPKFFEDLGIGVATGPAEAVQSWSG